MANPEHEAAVRSGRENYEKWRQIGQNSNVELDLRGGRFADADFTDYDLRKSNFAGADLSGATLVAANLRDCILDGANLQRANLARAQLDNASLIESNFNGANLIKATLDSVRAVNASFVSANLDWAMVTNSFLIGATFEGSSLFSANFHSSKLVGASLKNASCRRARFESAELISAKIHFADFFECYVDRALLSEVEGAQTVLNLDTVGGNARYFENCKRQWIDRYCDWEGIKRFGRQPLFALSYSVLIFIPIYIYFIAVYNSQVESARAWIAAHPEASTHARFAESYLQTMPMPSLTFWLLVATVLLAIASTIYTIGCPARIKEFSKEIWCEQFGHSLVQYWPQSWWNRRVRIICGACYIIGGGMALLILVVKVWNAGAYIVRHVEII